MRWIGNCEAQRERRRSVSCRRGHRCPSFPPTFPHQPPRDSNGPLCGCVVYSHSSATSGLTLVRSHALGVMPASHPSTVAPCELLSFTGHSVAKSTSVRRLLGPGLEASHAPTAHTCAQACGLLNFAGGETKPDAGGRGNVFHDGIGCATRHQSDCNHVAII